MVYGEVSKATKSAVLERGIDNVTSPKDLRLRYFQREQSVRGVKRGVSDNPKPLRKRVHTIHADVA